MISDQGGREGSFVECAAARGGGGGCVELVVAHHPCIKASELAAHNKGRGGEQ